MTCRIEESETQEAMFQLISDNDHMLSDNDFPALVLAPSKKLLAEAQQAFEIGRRLPCDVVRDGILQEKREQHAGRAGPYKVLLVAAKDLSMDPDDPEYSEDVKYAIAPPLLLPIASVKQIVVVGAQSFRANYLAELAEVAFDQVANIDILLLAWGSGDSYETRMDDIYSKLVAESSTESTAVSGGGS